MSAITVQTMEAWNARASVVFVALLLANSAPASADEFEWGPLATQPRNDQNTIWDAHCNTSSEHVVSGQRTITEGSGTLQNVGVNDERDTWTCVWGQTVKATARALGTNDDERSPLLPVIACETPHRVSKWR
jgi:hypothetical protein